MGIKTLRKIQLGQEATPGSPVVATALWRGMGSMSDEQELQFVEEDIGVLAQPDSAYIAQLFASMAFDEVDATFEQLPYILSAGVEDVVDGVMDGESVDPYVYAYSMPHEVANSIQHYTIEFGDDTGAEEMEYGFVQEFSLSGAAGEAVKMGATWGGRQATPTTFTGAISVPSTEVILFNKGRFYIDDKGEEAFGTTRKTDTLLAFELNVTTGWIARYTCDEQLYFRFLRATRPEVTLSLTMEHNATAIAEKVNARTAGGTVRLIRLEFEGSTFTTPGTNYSKKTLTIDIAGKYTTVPSLEDEDGDNVLTYELTGCFVQDAWGDPTPDTDAYCDFVVVNGNASLT